jgi:hypothetical protein
MSRLTSDYEALAGNEFWLMYLDKIKEHRASVSRMLETATIEKIPRLQGEVLATDFIVGLPDSIIRSLTEKSKI